MSLSFLRTDQPAVQGQRMPFDWKWLTWLRGLMDEVNRIAAKAWNASMSEALQLPQMTETERDALAAENGMLVYNTTSDKGQIYEAGAWRDL